MRGRELLYRVFPWLPTAPVTGPGGALFVPRSRQGAGRHDNPDHYGALYVSRSAESAVAERIASFRSQELSDADFVTTGGQYALAAIEDADLAPLPHLDDPAELAGRALRPSRVASLDRSLTQPIALGLFQEGAAGFAWWSTLNAAWANVTLFAERALGELRLAGPPEPLTTVHPVVRTVAPLLGVSGTEATMARRLRRVK